MKNTLLILAGAVIALNTALAQCAYLPIYGDSDVCTGVVYTYSTITTPPLKELYNWQIHGGTIVSQNNQPSIQVTWDLTGSRYILLSYSDGNCINYTTQKSVSVSFTETPIINADKSEVCQGGTVTYTTAPGKSNYSWVISPGGQISGPNNGNSIKVKWNTSGTKTVSVSYLGQCLSFTGSRNTLVKPAPNTPTIDGPSIVCGNTGGHIYTTEPGMISYVWNVYGGSITSGIGTNSITITWSTGGGYLQVSYNNAEGCGSVSPNKYVTGKFVIGESIPNSWPIICHDEAAPPITMHDDHHLNNENVYFQWKKANSLYDTYTDIPNATSISYSPLTNETGSFKRLAYTTLNGVVCPTSNLSAPALIRKNGVYGGVIGFNNIGSGSYIISEQYICAGHSPVAFSSVYGIPPSGSGTLSIQWQKSTDGHNFVDIDGATSVIYTLPILTSTTYYRRKAISTWLYDPVCDAYPFSTNSYNQQNHLLGSILIPIADI